MFTKLHFFSLALCVSFAGQAYAHGALVNIAGANGVQASGFGIIESTPRDGSTRNPFEQDTSIIRDVEIKTGQASACGRTLAGGVNDIATQLANASAAGLPTAAADGTVSMTLHQVNADGAGPYTCDVSGDGGQTFTAATVTTNVPGKNSLSNAKATDFALVAQMPASVACTGGPNGDACIVRCRNSALAGPFGGCAAVASASSSTSNATETSSTSNSTTTDSVASDSTTSDASTSETTSTASSDDAESTTSIGSTDSTTGESTTSADSTGSSTSNTEGATDAASLVANAKSAKDAVKHARRYMTSRVIGKRSNFWIKA